MNERVLSVAGVKKSFALPSGSKLEILRGVSFELARGASLAVMGMSGSGKTTLLHIIAGIESRDAGSIEIAGGAPGLIFQAHYLMPEFNCVENVALAARMRGASPREAEDIAYQLLIDVGLDARTRHLPSELSGGETARVAIARALASNPVVLLADEPTGNLDEETSARIQDLLFGVIERCGASLVIVTHEPSVAARAGRIAKLEHGMLTPVKA